MAVTEGLSILEGKPLLCECAGQEEGRGQHHCLAILLPFLFLFIPEPNPLEYLQHFQWDPSPQLIISGKNLPGTLKGVSYRRDSPAKLKMKTDSQ